MPQVRDKPPRYRSYLLRMWEARGERPDEPPTWRFRMQDARTGAQRAFPDLEALVAFLRDEMERDTKV
jgi:hypothetical protein